MKQPIKENEEIQNGQCIMPFSKLRATKFDELLGLLDKHDEIFVLIPSSTQPLKITRAKLT